MSRLILGDHPGFEGRPINVPAIAIKLPSTEQLEDPDRNKERIKRLSRRGQQLVRSLKLKEELGDNE